MPLLVNPLKYSDMYLPSGLKGSRGGLWLRTTKKNYAKHLMYENRDSLRFFRYRDNYKYFLWQPYVDFGLHFYNQRELLNLNADNFFNNFFSGVKKVFTPTKNRAHVIGGVSHYEIYHQYLASSDIHTFIINAPFSKSVKYVSLFFYRIYMFFAPKFVDFVYSVYFYFYDQIHFISFFLSGVLRAQVEFTSYNIDSEYMPYLKFIEFYKLPGYMFFEYHLSSRTKFFTQDTRRHYQTYFFKEING